MTVGLRVAALVCAAALAAAGARPVAAAAPPTAGRWQDTSLEDYRKHLVTLAGLTQACAKARDVKTCDPLLVGLDDRVPLGASGERRLVRYGWLRVLFSRAEESDDAQQAPRAGRQVETSDESVRPKPRTTSQLLEDALARLQADLARAGEAPLAQAGHAKERATMEEVLAGREFRGLKQPDARDSLMERLNRWLNRLFEGVDKLKTRAAWVGRALIWGFLLAVGVGLTWWLLQMERRWRIRLLPESEGPSPEAASARDWQLWMADAREAAGLGLWREGIHFLYWAVISRLESKRLWPADRARTPREYFALVAPDDLRKPGLASLTATFERVWYGGREAGEEDYRRAERLTGNLIAGMGTAEASGRAGEPTSAGSAAS
ncbi:MAG TPA: DUF4129 domain-containing protein [Nevskia sp.]|nr:DUF4129 domain-containing protein [Nevskia sp.]